MSEQLVCEKSSLEEIMEKAAGAATPSGKQKTESNISEYYTIVKPVKQVGAQDIALSCCDTTMEADIANDKARTLIRDIIDEYDVLENTEDILQGWKRDKDRILLKLRIIDDYVFEVESLLKRLQEQTDVMFEEVRQ